MNIRSTFILCISIILLSFSCKSPSNNLAELDLMSEGIPLKIKAPKDAAIKQKDMGIFKDITVKAADNFYLQITSGSIFNADKKARIAEELKNVKELNVFSRVVKEAGHGFIFEKKIGDKLSYDFRSIKNVGENEYLFQSGLIGTFTLEEVELMFDAVQ